MKTLVAISAAALAIGGTIATVALHAPQPSSEQTPSEYWEQDQADKAERIRRWKEAHPGREFDREGEIDLWKEERDEYLAHERELQGMLPENFDHAKDVHQLCSECAETASSINADIIDPLNTALDSAKEYRSLVEKTEREIMRNIHDIEDLLADENDDSVALKTLLDRSDALLAQQHAYANNMKTYKEKAATWRAKLSDALAQLSTCEQQEKCRRSSSSVPSQSSSHIVPTIDAAECEDLDVPPVEPTPYREGCDECAGYAKAVDEWEAALNCEIAKANAIGAGMGTAIHQWDAQFPEGQNASALQQRLGIAHQGMSMYAGQMDQSTAVLQQKNEAESALLSCEMDCLLRTAK